MSLHPIMAAALAPFAPAYSTVHDHADWLDHAAERRNGLADLARTRAEDEALIAAYAEYADDTGLLLSDAEIERRALRGVVEAGK